MGEGPGLLKRLCCRPTTPLPGDASSWSLREGKVVVDLGRTPELLAPGGAVRIEGRGLPDRLLLLHGVDGRFRAYSNHCACAGWRIDPVPGEERLRCCTLAQSTYDYDGRVLSGTARRPLTTYPVEVETDTLRIPL